MQIGPYTLVRELARGGMAQLWLAHHVWPDGKRRSCVVKLPRRSAAVDEGILQQFVEEGRLSILLGHTNIVSVFDVGVHESLPYLVMEYVPGADLARLLRASWRVGTTWEVETAVHVLREIGQGLLHAHEFELVGVPQHIIHRDVASKNVMVDGSGGIRLTDFGVATSLGTETSKLHAKGTLPYMAPEHYLGQPTQVSDVFGLGGIFWEMLAGRPFRDGLEGSALLSAVVAGAVEPVGRELPAVVERVLGGMLHPEASRRMSLSEVLLLMEDFPSRRITLRNMIALFFSAESKRTGLSQLHFAASKELTDTLAVAKAVGVSPRGEETRAPVGDHDPVPPDFVPGPVGVTAKVDRRALEGAEHEDVEDGIVDAPGHGTVRLEASIAEISGPAATFESTEPSPPTDLMPAPGTVRVPTRAASPERGHTQHSPSAPAARTTIRMVVGSASASTAGSRGSMQVDSRSTTEAARSPRWLPFAAVALVLIVGLGSATWIVWSRVVQHAAGVEGLEQASETVAVHATGSTVTHDLERDELAREIAAEPADRAATIVPAASFPVADARPTEEIPASARAVDGEEPPRAAVELSDVPSKPPPAAVKPKPRPPKPAVRVQLVVRRGLMVDFAELKVGTGKARVVPARGDLTVRVALGTYSLRYRTAPDGPWKSTRYIFSSNMTYAGHIEHSGLRISAAPHKGGTP